MPTHSKFAKNEDKMYIESVMDLRREKLNQFIKDLDLEYEDHSMKTKMDDKIYQLIHDSTNDEFDMIMARAKHLRIWTMEQLIDQWKKILAVEQNGTNQKVIKTTFSRNGKHCYNHSKKLK